MLEPKNPDNNGYPLFQIEAREPYKIQYLCQDDSSRKSHRWSCCTPFG